MREYRTQSARKDRKRAPLFLWIYWKRMAAKMMVKAEPRSKMLALPPVARTFLRLFRCSFQTVLNFAPRFFAFEYIIDSHTLDSAWLSVLELCYPDGAVAIIEFNPLSKSFRISHPYFCFFVFFSSMTICCSCRRFRTGYDDRSSTSSFPH